MNLLDIQSIIKNYIYISKNIYIDGKKIKTTKI